MKIYIGNLPSDVTHDEIKNLLKQFGTVSNVKTDVQFSNKKLVQYAIIGMPDHAEAIKTIEQLDKYEFRNYVLQVNPARTGPKNRRRDGRIGGRRSSDPSISYF